RGGWSGVARGGRAGGGSCMAVGLYILCCAMLHYRALEAWRGLDRPPAGATVGALPQFLSPFRWLGLSEEGREVHAAFFDVGPFARGSGHPHPPLPMSQRLSTPS